MGQTWCQARVKHGVGFFPEWLTIRSQKRVFFLVRTLKNNFPNSKSCKQNEAGS